MEAPLLVTALLADCRLQMLLAKLLGKENPDKGHPHCILTDPFCHVSVQFDDQILQLLTSSLFLAGAFAALVGMWTSKKFGRRFTMIWAGAAFIIGKQCTCTLSPAAAIFSSMYMAQLCGTVSLRSVVLHSGSARLAFMRAAADWKH